jgi:hypothetical protein
MQDRLERKRILCYSTTTVSSTTMVQSCERLALRVAVSLENGAKLASGKIQKVDEEVTYINNELNR